MKAKISRLLHSRSFGIFLFFWLLFGATTCLSNLRDYNLQQMGVDAIVSHHTFGLGHAKNPLLTPLGDVFGFRGRTLAAKQPGEFVWGAIPYFVLHLFGIDYELNYDLAAALVTWCSAGLMTALALAFLDRLLWKVWGFSRMASLVATLLLGMASTWFPYAGIAHHDIEAASLIVFALYAMESNRVLAQGRNLWLALLGGVFLGLTAFTSMLPALIVLVLGIAGLVTRSWRQAFMHVAGCFAGVVPLLFYNGWYFGSMFVPANVAGNYSDTFLSPRMDQFVDHVKEYLGTGGLSIWKYAPGLTLGFVGLALLPRSLRRLRYVLIAALLVHLFYVTNIETLGTCEYGPRYLLPIMALLAPGVAALFDWRESKSLLPGKLLAAGALIAYGFLVNVVGSLQGTMYCNLGQFALWERFPGIDRLQDNNAPLFGYWLLLPFLLFAVWAWLQLYAVFKPATGGLPAGVFVEPLVEAQISAVETPSAQKKGKQKQSAGSKQSERVPAEAGKKRS